MWSDKGNEEDEEEEVKTKKKVPAKKEEEEDDSDDKKVPEKIDPSVAAAELKKQRLAFLGNLAGKITTGTDKPFLAGTEQFNIMVYYK